MIFPVANTTPGEMFKPVVIITPWWDRTSSSTLPVSSPLLWIGNQGEANHERILSLFKESLVCLPLLRRGTEGEAPKILSHLKPIDTGFSVSARCTNAAAFVHKTLTTSVPESLETRLSEIVHIKIFRCLNTPDSYRDSLLNTIQ